MIKREFKVNFKSFTIWLAILIAMFLVVYLVYPYMITDETVKSMDELRVYVDSLEMILDRELWPMPSYGDLVFEVSEI